MTKKETEFLKESNAIEGVYDQLSLQQAAFAWEYLKVQKELTIGVMLKVHKILMLHQPLWPYEIGYLRKCTVYIGGRKGLDYTIIRPRLEILCLNMNGSPSNWKEHHIEYEKIHPFVDGNGRTGRMFMNWERRKAKLPILVIQSGARQKYYNWFK